MSDDVLLLRHYASQGDEQAFQQLVERYLPLVYSAAVRQVGGDAHLAQDISQQVFAALARSAEALDGREVLTGWLYRTTRNLAAKAVRTEQRRRAREQAAAREQEVTEMKANAPESAADWTTASEHLDAAMGDLPEPDRMAILLRFFRQLDFRAVGSELGVSDDTAQKRVSRALGRLRGLLGSRGVVLSVTALGTLLAENAVSAAPAGLAMKIVAGLPAASAAVQATAGFWPWAHSALSRTARWKLATGVSCVSLSLGLLFVGWLSVRPLPANFDLAADFPPPAGVATTWSVGWSATLGGELIPFGYVKNLRSNNGQPLTAWQVDEITRPTFAKNLGTRTAISAGGGFVALPGTVWLSADLGETDRRFGMARLTIPPGQAGAYRVASRVDPAFHGAFAGDTDFHILRNGVELFGRFLGPRASAAYSDVVELAAGDTIDFVVGQGKNRFDEGSTLLLTATVTLARSKPGRDEAPVMVASPSDEEALDGDPVAMEALATGTGPLHFQWWTANQPVPGGTNEVLHWTTARPVQAGAYHLVVSNASGAVTSAPARLTVVSCTPAPQGLAAWWQAESDSADSWNASSVATSTAVTYAPGRVGRALAFSGSGAGVTVPANAALDVGAGGEFTVEMWIKPDRVDGKVPLLGWNSTNAYGANLSIVNGRLYANLRDMEGVAHTIASEPSTIFVPFQWRHLALTFDGSAQSMRLYMNGLVQADVPTDTFRPNTTFDVQIGHRREQGTRLTYSGLMDEISLYRRALAPEEIAAISRAGAAGKCIEQVTAFRSSTAVRDP